MEKSNKKELGPFCYIVCFVFILFEEISIYYFSQEENCLAEIDRPRIEEDLVDDDDDGVFSSICSSRSKLSTTRRLDSSLQQLTGGLYSCASHSINSLAAPGSDRLSVCSQKSSGVYEDVESWLAPLSPHSNSSQSVLSENKERDSGVLSITESDEGAGNMTEEYVFMSQAPVAVPIRYRDDSQSNSASTSPARDGETSQLVSYKSMELLTSDVIKDISSFALEDSSPSHSFNDDDKTSSSDSYEEDATPAIPPRASSLVKSNQLITDKELIKQGQRLSQVLNITPVVPKRKISLVTVKNTFTKLLKHHKSSSALKQPFRKLSTEKQSSGQKRKLRSSVSTTSLPTSRINRLDCTPNQTYDHLSSWTGSSCDLNRSAHHPQLRLTSSYNPSSQCTSSSDSNLRRCAVSADNLCDLDGYSPRNSVATSDGYVSPQPTDAWSASDEEDQYDSYVPMADQFTLEDEQDYENIDLYNEEDRDYENLDSQEDDYVKYDPESEDDYVSLDEDEAEYKNVNPRREYLDRQYENFDPIQKRKEHKNTGDYENFDPQGMDTWRALRRLVSHGSEKEGHQVNTSVTVEEAPLDGYVDMKTWMRSEQIGLVNSQTGISAHMEEAQTVTNKAESENDNSEELDDDYEKVPVYKTKKVTRNFSAKFHFHAPPPPQFLPKLYCHIEEDEKKQEDKVDEEKEQLAFQTDDEIDKEHWENPASVDRFGFSSPPIIPSHFSSLRAVESCHSSQADDCHELPVTQRSASLARNTRTASSRQIRRWSHDTASTTDPSLKGRRTSEYQLRRSTPLTRKNMSKIRLNWMRTSGLSLQ